jgi:hypothetical protein
MRTLTPRRRRSGRRIQSTLLALVVLALSLVYVAAASAAGTTTLTVNQLDPVVGETLNYTSSLSGECPSPPTFTWRVDGTVKKAATATDGDSYTAAAKFSYAFPTAGSHTVTLVVTAPDGPGVTCDFGTGTITDTVGDAPGGTITASPDPVNPNVPEKVAVVPTGGQQPYGPTANDYRWKIDGVAAGTTRTISKTFTTLGAHTAEVSFSDSASPAHPITVKSTINVVAYVPPAPPAPGQPAPTPSPVVPAPCIQKLDFAISEFTTDGCFSKVSASPEQWATTDRVTLNGIPFADSGQRFLITFPTTAEPGGHVTSAAGAIQLDRFVPFSGSIDWSLPAGKQGDEGTLHEVAVPSFATLFKLRIAGSVAIKIGWDANGEHYATFPLNVELPPAFTAGPSRFAGGVSGAASLRADSTGVHYDGLKIAVKDVWVGQLKVPEACFSYVPAGGQAVAPCATPELDGAPYLTCNDDVNSDRWDGNAVIQLPTASETKLAAFGGLSNGNVSKLGGFVDGLGTTVPIVPGVFLNRIGVGLCLNPPPFKLRGDVGITALGGKFTVNGHVLYTDATETSPWSVEVGGSAAIADTTLGTGSVTFNAWGDVGFALHAGIDLKGVASVEGDIGGWVEPRNNTFSVSGSVKGCIASVICAKAMGLISSSGVAGCIDAGSITIDVPSNAKEGPFGFGSISFTTRKETIYLKAGFGYKFGSGKVNLLGNSCDLTPYDAARSASAHSAAAGISEKVARGEQAAALRIHGTNGPPKVVVHGPGGTTITSPATGSASQSKGHYVLAENKSDGTTSVLLIKPAAGTWTVTAAPGATSTPTRVDRSSFQAPSALFGQLRKVGAGRREAAVAYAVPAGATVSLVERGKGIAHTLVKTVHGTRCRGAKALPDGRRLLCARVKFTPSRGPGGTRTLQAVVSRGGLPLTSKDLVKFTVPRETAPAKPGALKARRVGGALVVAFPAAARASRYTVTAVLQDGRRLGFDLAGSCRAVRIPSVPLGDAATVKVAGVRYDLRVGAYRSITLASKKKTAGSTRGALPGRVCK